MADARTVRELNALAKELSRDGKHEASQAVSDRAERLLDRAAQDEVERPKSMDELIRDRASQP